MTKQISEDFRLGAKAMFDYLLYRAANNYHGNPKINEWCKTENIIIEKWAEDALADVSPEDCTTWRTLREYGDEIEQLHTWKNRACQVLPLIERESGSDLAIFVNTLLSGDIPPATDK